MLAECDGLPDEARQRAAVVLVPCTRVQNWNPIPFRFQPRIGNTARD